MLYLEIYHPPFPIFLSGSKIDKKGYLFPSRRHKSQLIKRVPFFIFANKCNRSLMLALSLTLRRKFNLQKSFHKLVFGILNRFEIDQKELQNQSVDGCCNFKITNFFLSENWKCSKFIKFIFLTFFLYAKHQKAYPFSSNK